MIRSKRKRRKNYETMDTFANILAVFLGFVLQVLIKTKGFGFLNELYEKLTLLPLETLTVCFVVILATMLIALAVSKSSKPVRSLLSSVVFGLIMLCSFWGIEMDRLEADGLLANIMAVIIILGPAIFFIIVEGIIAYFEGDDVYLGQRIGISFAFLILYCGGAVSAILEVFYDEFDELSFGPYSSYLIVWWVISQIFIYIDFDELTSSSSDVYPVSSTSNYDHEIISSTSNYNSEEWNRLNDDLDAIQSAMEQEYGPDWGKDL